MSYINYKNVLINDINKYKKNYTDIFSDKKKKVYSQLGEDGIIEYIFNIIGTTNKYFVEFGGWDGIHLSNTANLRINKEWNGLLLEGNKDIVNNTKNAKQINLYNEWITKDNINTIFNKYNVPTNFDLLSIDIDSDDYYVWKNLNYRPRIVIVETNPGIINDIPLVVIEGKSNIHSKCNYFGANLNAFFDLALNKKYTFLTMSQWNAFFIIDEEFYKFNIDKISKKECIEKYFIPEIYWCNRRNYVSPPYHWIIPPPSSL